MEKQDFDVMVERLKTSESYEVLRVESDEHGDEVEFKLTYFDRLEVDRVTRHLVMRRMAVPEDIKKDPEAERAVDLFDGKVIFSEVKICPTCGHRTFRNVTKQMGAMLQGLEVVW